MRRLHSPKFAHGSLCQSVIVIAFHKVEISMLADDASHEESSDEEHTSGAVLENATAAMLNDGLLSLFVSDSEDKEFSGFLEVSDNE